MTAAEPTDIGPGEGREDEPVPSPQALAQHALALYWAAMEGSDAIDQYTAVMDHDDEDLIRVALARLLAAERRLWAPVRALRDPMLEARMRMPAQKATP